MSNSSEHINYFAETDYRGKKIKFGIKPVDRAKHVYVIGKTGMGKSTLLENLAVQDIQGGEGVCFIDPHGSSAEVLLSYVPEERIRDVVYFAPFDQGYPLALNVMEDIGQDKRALVASGLIAAFKKVWVDAWSPRMEYILNNALLALMETPGSTLLGVNRMFADKSYRESIVANVTDPSVRAFWLDEYAKYSDKFATEATAAIQNKVGQFAANPLIRNIIGQPQSKFDIRKLMDEKKIFIVNLSKGRIGEGNANLLGSMLITKIYLAAMSRAELHPSEVSKLPPFYMYVDEFQSFANESFADILSEARKYKLSLTIAHQYIEQMSEEVRAAVFGNVGTMITFRVGSYDAEVLEKEFAPEFTAEDIVNLGFVQIYLKLMINGVGSHPFSATTLDRPKSPKESYVEDIIDSSRAQFASPRAEIEEAIRKWHEPVSGPSRHDDPNVPQTRKIPPRDQGSFTERRGEQSRDRYPSNDRPQRQEQRYNDHPQQYGREQGMRSQSQSDGERPQRRYTDAPPTPVAKPFADAFAKAVLPGVEIKEAQMVPPTSSSQSEVTPPPVHAHRVVPHAPPKATPPPIATTLVRPEPTQQISTERPPAPSVVPSVARSVPSNTRTIADVQQGAERNDRDHGASLHTLKTAPKRDKGPSEGNLSSLRNAIALATKQAEKTPVVNTAPLPTNATPRFEIQPQPIAPVAVKNEPRELLKEEKLTTPLPVFTQRQSPPPVVRPEANSRPTPITPSIAPRPIGEVKPNIPTPPAPSAQERVPQSVSPERERPTLSTAIPEIPEDVLLRLLAID